MFLVRLWTTVIVILGTVGWFGLLVMPSAVDRVERRMKLEAMGRTMTVMELELRTRVQAADRQAALLAATPATRRFLTAVSPRDEAQRGRVRTKRGARSPEPRVDPSVLAQAAFSLVGPSGAGLPMAILDQSGQVAAARGMESTSKVMEVPVVSKAMRSMVPVSGLERGERGLAYYTVTPVLDQAGRLLGATLVTVPMGRGLAATLAKLGGEQVALLHGNEMVAATLPAAVVPGLMAVLPTIRPGARAQVVDLDEQGAWRVATLAPGWASGALLVLAAAPYGASAQVDLVGEVMRFVSEHRDDPELAVLGLGVLFLLVGGWVLPWRAVSVPAKRLAKDIQGLRTDPHRAVLVPERYPRFLRDLAAQAQLTVDDALAEGEEMIRTLSAPPVQPPAMGHREEHHAWEGDAGVSRANQAFVRTETPGLSELTGIVTKGAEAEEAGHEVLAEEPAKETLPKSPGGSKADVEGSRGDGPGLEEIDEARADVDRAVEDDPGAEPVQEPGRHESARGAPDHDQTGEGGT